MEHFLRSDGQPKPSLQPDGLDLILLARAMRHRWAAAACARLFTRVSNTIVRLGAQLVARPRPARLGASR